MSAEDMARQNHIYAQALAAFDPRDVDAACTEWPTRSAESAKFWPELSALAALTREHEQLREVASRPRLGGPSGSGAPKRPLTPSERLAMWRKNDGLAAAMRASPEKYFCAPALLSLHDGMAAKRHAEHPDLAARYYGGADAP